MAATASLNYALREWWRMNPTRVARKPDQCHQFGICQPKNAAKMLPQRQSGTPTALQRAVRARDAAKPKKQRRKWNIQPVRLAAADRVAYPPGQRPVRTPAAPSVKREVPRARTPAAAGPKSVARARTPAVDAPASSRTPRVTPPKTAITSHAALAAKRARHLAAGDATPRHQPAPASVLEQKALIAEEQPVRGAQARAVTPDEGSHQRRDLRAVVYDAEKKTLLWQAPEGVQPVPYGEALTMARPPRYVRAFYDVASGETCWTADERVPAAATASDARGAAAASPVASPCWTAEDRAPVARAGGDTSDAVSDAASDADVADASDAASDACIDARGTAAAASPAASSEYSEAFETDDESFAVDDAEVGASCFFDDVCNTGVAEKRRHLALDGGMEEMRRRIERMEVSLREGGIVPA